MAYPSILGDGKSLVNIYSRESVIAEKLEAIVSLGIANSRYKDFYDICILSEHEDFDGGLLREAIKETFEHRNTKLDQIAAFEENFVTPLKEIQWKGFLRNKSVRDSRNLTDVLNEIKTFLLPVIQSIQSDKPFRQEWNPVQQNWTE